MTTVVLSTRQEAIGRAKQIRMMLDDMDAVAERVAPLLALAKEREDWRVRGFESWEDYTVRELGISRRRSYQLLDQVRVEQALSAGVGTPIAVPERAARDVKDHVAAVVVGARRNVANGMSPQAAVDAAVADTRRSVAEDYAARGALQKPAGRHHGYETMTEKVRGWTAVLTVVAEQRTGELAPDFAQALRAHRAVVELLT